MGSILEVLPQETLDCILDCFGSQRTGVDWEDTWWANLPTLKACSLVCKRFRNRAQYHILSLIRLYDRSGPLAITLKERRAGLCSLLAVRPELARGQRHVSIAFHRQPTSADTENRDYRAMISKDAAAILKSFVQAGAVITTLSIATPSTETSRYRERDKSLVQDDDEELGSCMSLADITCLIVQASRVPISVISGAPKLSTLWMHNAGFWPVEADWKPPSGKRPKILHLKLSGTSFRELDQLLRPARFLSFRDLRSLDVDPIGDFPGNFASGLYSIQHLRIDHGLEVTTVPESSKRFKLSKFKELRSLYLEFDLAKNKFPEPQETLFDLLRHDLTSLPATHLENVHVRFLVYPQLFFEEDYLIERFPWPTFWTALEHLQQKVSMGPCNIRVDFLERFWPVDGVDVKMPTTCPAVDAFLLAQTGAFESAIRGPSSATVILTHTLRIGDDEIISSVWK